VDQRINDIVNGLFELSGGVFLWLNVYRLYKAKCVRGVSMLAFGFFAIWGYWNLYYYPCLNQMASLIGASSCTAANTVWIILAIRYERKNHGKNKC